jgi:HPt (histidine-containing phosphotransfer) domain-containing protein
MSERRLGEVKMDLPANMYINYLARRRADHAKLASALSSGRAIEDFKMVGHQIKGNATSFGFDDLVSIGERMEKMSTANGSKFADEAPLVLSDFWSWILKTEKRLAAR